MALTDTNRSPMTKEMLEVLIRLYDAGIIDQDTLRSYFPINIDYESFLIKPIGGIYIEEEIESRFEILDL